MSKWELHWLTNWEVIWSDEFQAQWHGWMEQSCSTHVFFHPALARAWVETYLPLRDMKPLFLVARHDDVTVFFPLILWRRNWKNAFLREIIPLGYSDFDYHNPIIIGAFEDFDGDDFWGALTIGLEKLNISFDRLNFPGITRHFSGRDDRWTPAELCPTLDISIFNNPEDFLHFCKKSFRDPLKRRTKRLNELGKVDYHVYSNDEIQEAITILPCFLKAHSRRWPNAYKHQMFHLNIIQYGILARIVHFSELRLDGKPISWQLGFIFQHCFYAYMTAFDNLWAQYSPGQIQLLKCIEESIRLGMTTFNHLRGTESYKAGWTNGSMQLQQMTAISKRQTSQIKCYLVDSVKPMLLKALQ